GGGPMRIRRASPVIARVILLIGLTAFGLGVEVGWVQAEAELGNSGRTPPASTHPHSGFFNTRPKTPVPLGRPRSQPRSASFRRPTQDSTFTVNSTADFPDATPEDGTCDTGRSVPPATVSPECTLRAAIQEATAASATSTIVLPAGTYLLTQTAGFG